MLRDRHAIRTPIVRHVLGAQFLQVWGVGVVTIVLRSQVPLQRSKLENRENDIFGVKTSLFGGPPWNH